MRVQELVHKTGKRSAVAIVIICVAGLGFAVSASDGTIDFSSEPAQIVGEYVQGAYVEACINEYCPGPANGGYIGAFYAEAADGDRVFAWCIQAGAMVGVGTFDTYSEVTIDGRISYLTWRYDKDLYEAGGVASYELAAVQALAWAWVSDARFDPDVFDGTDPLSWDGLTPSPWTSSASNRVGFSTNVNGSAGVMSLATQATYDLAVEATANAGPWSFAASETGVTLSGINGPIQGEEILFNVGGQVATDSSGFAAWPNSASSASVEGPGLSFETRPSNSQDLLVSTVGVELSVNRPADTPDPTTTTTVAPTTTTTVAPTTTTTVASTTTTTVASTTTTTVAQTTTTTGPEFLPATGVSSKTNWLFFGAILIGSGVLLVTGARRSEPRRSQ